MLKATTMMKAISDYAKAFFGLKNFKDLLDHRRTGKEVEIITRKGNTLRLPPLAPSDVFSLLKSEDMIKTIFPRAEVHYKGKILEFFIGLPESMCVLYEVFKKEEYKADVKGRVVVDVGGFIGDTAIYYYLNGAEKVITVEAHPRNFEVLKRNIQANDIPLDKVQPINAAVGTGDAALFPLETKGGSTRVAGDESGEVIEAPGITIDELTEGYDNVLLKMDCEGCEFEAIQHSSLDNVSEIILEYHCDKIDCRTMLAEMLKKKGFVEIHTTSETLPDGRIIGIMKFTKG